MKKSLYSAIFSILIISPAIVTAQLNHFIYLQTEGKQPFYVKLEKKILSSSASGYLIIPKLKDGTYNITVGFPKNENSEQTFVCNINNNDAGYLVKNFGEKGWGLFNLQTLDIVMSGTQAKEKDLAKTEKADAFSNMLSDVVNDPSIKLAEKPVEAKKEVVKKEEVKEEPKIAAIPASENKLPPLADQPLKTAILKTKTVIGEKGTDITYIDVNGSSKDTVNIFIPVENAGAEVTEGKKTGEVAITVEKSAPPAEIKETPVVTEPTQADEPAKILETAAKPDTKPVVEELPVLKTEQPAEGKKFLPIEVAVAEKPNTVSEQPATTPMVNSDCKNYAAEEDFLKLRKKMAGATNDDDMIAAAQKAFKTKCYSTDQVKNLSVLFLKDAGKYRFFDLCYQHVSDSHNFGILEGQLTEPYYISRFKAMIRH